MQSLQIDSGGSNDCGSRALGACARSGLRRLLITIAVVLALGTSIYCLNKLARSSDASLLEVREPDSQNVELTELNLGLTLLSQQLDELFRMFAQRISAEKTLTPDDQRMLESWLQFDERFLERIQDSQVLKYERVTVHLRVGFGLSRLDMPEPSIPHFESAIRLLNELIKDNPVIASYRTDQSDAYYGLGRSMQALGRTRESIESYDSAIEILRDPRSPAASGRQERLEELYLQKHQLLVPNVTSQ